MSRIKRRAGKTMERCTDTSFVLQNSELGRNRNAQTLATISDSERAVGASCCLGLDARCLYTCYS